MVNGAPEIDRPYIYVNNPEGGLRESIRFGQWKAVRQPTKTTIELYRLSTDLGEKNDIAARHPAVVRRATALMADTKS